QNSYAFYRVAQVTLNGSPNYMAFKVDFEDGNGYQSFGHCKSDSDHSWAKGEAVRFGGTDTTVTTVQHNLQYRNSSGNWVAWSGTECTSEGFGIPGWFRHLGPDSFTV